MKIRIYICFGKKKTENNLLLRIRFIGFHLASEMLLGKEKHKCVMKKVSF